VSRQSAHNWLVKYRARLAGPRSRPPRRIAATVRGQPRLTGLPSGTKTWNGWRSCSAEAMASNSSAPPD